MTGYWSRQRLIQTLIMTIAEALIAGLLFVFPSISKQASSYNAQSIYKNTSIDFIVPEPSEDQVAELPGTNGIDKIFPFYLTKTQVNVNGNTRTTTVLLSDQFENAGNTMYNDARLIERSSSEYDKPILVDWAFCQSSSASLGDVVSLTINGTSVEYRISAIYETNTVYDGGAILAPITAEQKASIMEASKNNGYSGMYVIANDYGACRSFLTTDYRPMGRLKDRTQFENDEKYQVHYDAIMGSAYANEITDFRIRENSLDAGANSLMIWLGALLSMAIIIAFNVVMARRGCEKVYFRKHCIPKGQNVSSYYSVAFVLEIIMLLVFFAAAMFVRIRFSTDYIPASAMGISLIVVPVAIIIAEIISLCMNKSMLAGIKEAVRIEQEKKAAEEKAKAARMAELAEESAKTEVKED